MGPSDGAGTDELPRPCWDDRLYVRSEKNDGESCIGTSRIEGVRNLIKVIATAILKKVRGVMSW